MIGLIDKFFGKGADENKSGEDGKEEHDTLVATCALLLEIANIDGEFSEKEQERILSILESHFHLSGDLAKELMKKAGEELENSIDLWRFTNLINQNYSRNEKMGVVEMIWRVVFADETLDKHEDYLMHKLAKLLRLSHKDLIDAKMKVKGKA